MPKAKLVRIEPPGEIFYTIELVISETELKEYWNANNLHNPGITRIIYAIDCVTVDKSSPQNQHAFRQYDGRWDH